MRTWPNYRLQTGAAGAFTQTKSSFRRLCNLEFIIIFQWLPHTIHSDPTLCRLPFGSRNARAFINMKSSVFLRVRTKTTAIVTVRMRRCINEECLTTTTNNQQIATEAHGDEKWVSHIREKQVRQKKQRKQHENEIFITRKYLLVVRLYSLYSVYTHYSQRSHRPTLARTGRRQSTFVIRTLEKSNERNGTKPHRKN